MELVITAVPTNENRIPAIKALREVTNLGLKDSKLIIDSVAAGETRQISLNKEKATRATTTLHNAGFTFSTYDPSDDIIQHIKAAIQLATQREMPSVLPHLTVAFAKALELKEQIT